MGKAPELKHSKKTGLKKAEEMAAKQGVKPVPFAVLWEKAKGIAPEWESADEFLAEARQAWSPVRTDNER